MQFLEKEDRANAAGWRTGKRQTAPAPASPEGKTVNEGSEKTHLLCPERSRSLKNILLSENKWVSPKHKPFWFLTNMLLQSARLLVVSVPISSRIHAELCRLEAVAWLAQGRAEGAGRARGGGRSATSSERTGKDEHHGAC